MTDKKKEKIHWSIVCTGIICIAGLEGYALSLGINGVFLGTTLFIIAGIVTGAVVPLDKIIKR